MGPVKVDGVFGTDSTGVMKVTEGANEFENSTGAGIVIAWGVGETETGTGINGVGVVKRGCGTSGGGAELAMGIKGGGSLP